MARLHVWKQHFSRAALLLNCTEMFTTVRQVRDRVASLQLRILLRLPPHSHSLHCSRCWPSRIFFGALTHIALITPAGVILLFGLLAVVFRRFDVGSYRSLSDASRLIFISHNVFFLIFLLTAIPYIISTGTPSGHVRAGGTT